MIDAGGRTRKGGKTVIFGSVCPDCAAFVSFHGFFKFFGRNTCNRCFASLELGERCGTTGPTGTEPEFSSQQRGSLPARSYFFMGTGFSPVLRGDHGPLPRRL